MTKGYPHKQPFCVSPRRNQVKENSWWNPSSTTYWKNQKKTQRVSLKG